MIVSRKRTPRWRRFAFTTWNGTEWNPNSNGPLRSIQAMLRPCTGMLYLSRLLAEKKSPSRN